MRLFKLLSLALLAVAALLGGFLVAGIIAAATVAAWLARRFLFKSASPELTFRWGSASTSPESSLDVIDVSATEISASRHP